MSTFEQIEAKVIQWANDRQIIQNSTPLAQARKTLEECGELLEAASAIQALGWSDPRFGAYYDAYKDAVGDVIVTLLVGTATTGIDLTECLEMAYEQIKDRQGTLRADGVFVKDGA